MENFIPRLFNHDDSPLIETVTDLESAMEYYHFIGDTGKVSAKISIMDFLRESCEGETIDIPSKIYHLLPSEMNIREVEDFDVVYNEYVHPDMFMYDYKRDPSSQFIDVISNAAKNIAANCEDSMDPTSAMNTWECFMSNIRAMKTFISPSVYARYQHLFALMTDTLNDINISEYGNILDSKANHNNEIVNIFLLYDKLRLCIGGDMKHGTSSTELKRLGNDIKKQLNVLCNNDFFKPRKSIFPKWSDGYMSYEINKLLTELNNRVSTREVKFLSNKRDFARIEHAIKCEKYFDKNKMEMFIFNDAESDHAILARFHNSVGLLTVDDTGDMTVIVLYNADGFEYNTLNILTGACKNKIPFKRIPIVFNFDKRVEESASLNIDEYGTITVTYNSKISPMDSYSELHHQLIIAYKSNSGEDMKVILATILYNITEYEREYYKLKKKGKQTKKMNEIERARMFLKNDFAQYFPKYLEYSNEDDFIKFYNSQGFGKKEYSVTTDNIRGIKKIIHAIM